MAMRGRSPGLVYYVRHNQKETPGEIERSKYFMVGPSVNTEVSSWESRFSYGGGLFSLREKPLPPLSPFDFQEQTRCVVLTKKE